MLTFSDIKTEVRGRLKDSASMMTDTYFKRWAQMFYSAILNRTGGYWLYDEYTFSTADETATYALPSRFMKMIQLRDETNNAVLESQFPHDERWDPDRSSEGTPKYYNFVYLREVQAQPSSASVISVVSASASDVSTYTVTVKGVYSSTEYEEVLTVNGLTSVSTTNAFSEVYGVAKNKASNGIYTVTAGATTLVSLAADELKRQHQWIRLRGEPDGTYTIRAIFLRKPKSVLTDYDTFDIPEYFENCAVLYHEYLARKWFYEQTAPAAYAEFEKELTLAQANFEKHADQRIQHGLIEEYEEPYGYISRRA